MPDVGIVIQYRATCDLNTMWQRFGRAARGPGTEAIAVLLAESKYFDDTKEKAAKAAEVRAQKALQKAEKKEKAKRAASSTEAGPSAKRQKTAHASSETPTTDDNAPILIEDLSSAAQAPLSPAEPQAGSAESTPSLTVYEQLRVSYGKKSTGNNDIRVPDAPDDSIGVQIKPEMDNFINAATRPYKCYRVPIMAYYENDRRSE